MKAYQTSIDEVLSALKVNERVGLSAYVAQTRQQSMGPNALEGTPSKGVLALFFSQFQDPMVLILVAAGLLSFVLKEYIDAAIIISVIVMNALIGVVQEYKAEKAIEALQKLSTPKVRVVRDGFIQTIDASQLVVADIVHLEAGNYIPADLRLLSSTSLKVEESVLTGESEGVDKDAAFITRDTLSIHDQKNMVFMSTFVTYGSGVGVVVATAKQSEVGQVAAMLKEHTNEKTPLQIRLSKLSSVLGVSSLLLCAVMFIVALWQGREFFNMLLISISLAVAAIPEGLPAVVTIVLALGVQRMSKHKAIVRKLHAVETLGCVSVICSDKTGTLTQNKMHVVEVYCEGTQRPNKRMLQGLALCNNVHIQKDGLVGEPTEKALVEYALQQGVDKRTLEATSTRVQEIVFDSMRKRMSTMYTHERGFYSYTKGALESVLDLCVYVSQGDAQVVLTALRKEVIIKQAQRMSAKAQRVLVIAYKNTTTKNIQDMERNLVFVGLVGLMDPPRVEVKKSVALCHKAGIRVNMITGDNPLTAYAIAQQLRIAKDEKEIIQGRDLDTLSDEALCANIHKYHVFARVTPQHKVRIVKALKTNGEVVAMSGDGVNDAPSLKRADIGIAMGKEGSDVCKEASDIILSDDNFATIVSAVEEGRNIYLNIKKAVLYLLSCNLGEIMALFLATLLMPNVVSTLNAVQILWVNLVTDAFPALALGVDPKDAFIMEQPPRDTKESLFAHGGVSFTILNGMLIGTMSIVAFRYGLNTSERMAQTMAFMVLSISQLFHALNLTSRTHSIFKVGLCKNRWLILTIVFGVALQVCVASLPIFQTVLKTVSLDASHWLFVFASSLLIIVVNEVSKWVAKGHTEAKK